MKILITGANGMVARAAIEHCKSIGDEVAALTRSELDIGDKDAVNAVVEAHRPGAILNCAAFTDVDGAESNADSAHRANVVGVQNLAAAARRYSARFLTISTDYVFDGSHSGFYTQHDTPNPLGAYARSKFDGENAARLTYARSIVVRTGWIYGHGGSNFLSVMHRLLAEGKPIKAIGDAFGTPTYAGDLVTRMRELVELDLPCIYHVTNAGPGTSYLGFAEKVCEIGGLRKELITAVSDNDLSRPAPRPKSSKLACLFSERFCLAPMPDWEAALEKFLNKAS